MRACVFALLLLWCQPVLAGSCADATSRVAASFMRRVARDASDLIAKGDVDVEFVDQMTFGVPSNAGERAVDKATRLWRHTENKIRRHCLDAEAAAAFPGFGQTTSEVADGFFNLYGLPWVSAMRATVRPHGRQCARVAILRAGYAARDEIRKGRDQWAYYWKAVDQVCPPQLLAEIRQLSAPYLSALEALGN